MALPELKRLLRERELRVTSVNSSGFFLWAEPERAARQTELNQKLIRCAAEFESDTLVLIGGGLHDMGEEDPLQLAKARARVDPRDPGHPGSGQAHRRQARDRADASATDFH